MGAQRGAVIINASLERVEDVAVQYQRQVDNLKYKGGEVKVLIPSDVSVVKRIVTDRSALKTGADVSVQGARSRGSALAATQITISGAAALAPLTS